MYTIFTRHKQCKLVDFYRAKPKIVTLCRNIFCPGCQGTGVNRNSDHQSGYSITIARNNNGNYNGDSGGGICVNTDISNYRNGRNIKGEHGPKCSKCNGVGYHRQFRKFSLYLQGLTNGDIITFENEGDHWSPYLKAGNVILTLKQKVHKLFQRKSHNLFFKKHISLKTALVGAHTNGIFFQHIDGRNIRMESSVVGQTIKPFDIKCIKYEGMPFDPTMRGININSCNNDNYNYSNFGGPTHYDGKVIETPRDVSLLEKGDLFVQFIIDFPTQISPHASEVKSIYI